MERTKKINELKVLKEKIEQKKLLIKKEKQELHSLEEQLEKVIKSELPILLFVINETLPMPDDFRDWKYEYVYYYPDFDLVKHIYKHKDDELLSNSIDLRKTFEKVGMPKFIWPGSLKSDAESYKKLEFVISYLRDIINNLFETEEIKSWKDLGSYLKDLDIEKGNIKVLILNNSKK